ncbi:MAG TPA: TraB/GumN family protein [Methanotrichaceae archaeon]|nr:TraB/GumN family protein [Methanotrichaceae archaeon]
MENSDKREESAAPLCLGLDQSASLGSPAQGAEAHEVVVVGTAHVSEKSVQEVTKAIEDMKPDIVAVELCPARYRAMTGQEEEQEIKISELLSGGKIYFVLVQWFLAYIQKRIGKEMGVRPGAEMLAAIEAAQKTGAKVALVDRDVGITIQRFWSAMGIVDKTKLIFALIPAAFGWGEEELDIDSITQDDIVSQMISEFRKVSPSAANVLVDERDAYIAQNLVNLSKHGRVLAVVGAGHKEGIARHLAHPESIPAIEKLKEKPQKKITFAKVFGAAVTLLILGTIGLVLINAQSSQSILLAFGIWFLVTGGLSCLGVIIARGHPLSALTAFLVAWMTTLNPLVAAGWFAGMVEAWKLKPTVSDLKRLAQADSFDEMRKNRFFRVILVAALANVGAMAGTFLGIYLIWQRLGLINPSELLNGII